MRHYSNAAVETELVLLVDATATQVTVKESTGYPAQVPFTAQFDPDATPEEIVLVTGRTGNTWDVVRGWGGTTAVEHKAGAKVRHAAVAEDFREAAIVYRHLFGDPQYNPNDPAAPPTNPPLVDPSDYVLRSKNTWGDLL